MYLDFDKTQRSSCRRFLITPKLFVFFYSSSLASLLPFLPIFFRLNGLSAFENGVLVASRYLVLFWAAPCMSFLASKMNLRKTILVLAVLLGAMANTGFLFTSNQSGVHIVYRLDQDCITRDTNYSINHKSHTAFVVRQTNVTSPILPTGSNDNNVPEKYDYKFRRNIDHEMFSISGLKLHKKFLIFLLIVLFGTLLSSPAKPLHEMLTLAIIKEFKENYNIQRLCSCLGWSLMSFGTALAVYKLPCTNFDLTKDPFNVHFYFHILFSMTTIMFGVLMKPPAHKTTAKIKLCRILRVTCKSSNIIMVLITMAILGTAQSLHSSYLFWYIMDLGGTELHMGLILLVSGLSQIPLLFLTRHLIHWLGHGWIFALSLSAFAARFLLYTYVSNPIMVLPIELLHSLTSSSIWLTSTSVAVLVAPIGAERSMQNLFTASYYGLGMGFGGLLTSIAYHLYGSEIVFQCAAAVCAVYAVILGILQCLVSPPDENQGFPINGDYYKVGVNVNTSSQSDWLLDALNAEEEEIHYSR